MMQLCSLASSTSAHIKDQLVLVLEVEEQRRIAEHHDTQTASGRVVTVGDLPRRFARGRQLVLRVGGSNGMDHTPYSFILLHYVVSFPLV